MTILGSDQVVDTFIVLLSRENAKLPEFLYIIGRLAQCRLFLTTIRYIGSFRSGRGGNILWLQYISGSPEPAYF